jgi:hypothetical protein
MPKKSKSKSKPKFKTAEEIAQRTRERFSEMERRDHKRALAVIAEFGGQKPEGRMLVPTDDPANDKVKMALAGEVLRLRYQMRLLNSATEFASLAGGPFGIIPPEPLWEGYKKQDCDK